MPARRIRLDVEDTPRLFEKATEPFMRTIRQLSGEKDTKIISWYIAALDEDFKGQAMGEKEKFGVEFFTYDAALTKLTFEGDRDIMKKAIEIVTGT